MDKYLKTAAARAADIRCSLALVVGMVERGDGDAVELAIEATRDIERDAKDLARILGSVVNGSTPHEETGRDE